jgi:hypothetical protein
MPKKKTTETDRLRTIYLADDDRDTLASVADVQEVGRSTIVRKILEDYNAGRLKVTPPPVHKTSVLVEDDVWEEALRKTKAEHTSIAKVIAAGIARLRGGRR